MSIYGGISTGLLLDSTAGIGIPDMAASYGERILAARAKLGVGQRKFAKMVAAELGSVQHWEHGRREPTGPYKARLDQLLNEVERGGESPSAFSV
jgi:DNA-binding transcriptional regulator YiaG